MTYCCFNLHFLMLVGLNIFSYVYWLRVSSSVNCLFIYIYSYTSAFLLYYLFFLIDSLHILDTVLSVICYRHFLLICTLPSSFIFWIIQKFLFVVIVSNPFLWLILYIFVLEILSYPSNIKNASYFF